MISRVESDSAEYLGARLGVLGVLGALVVNPGLAEAELTKPATPCSFVTRAMMVGGGELNHQGTKSTKVKHQGMK